MLIHNKEKKEVIYSMDSERGIVQGRVTYYRLSDHELTFSHTGRTVPTTPDNALFDIGLLFAALGIELGREAVEESNDDSPLMASEPETDDA